ncbi:MAG: type II toxin-antitoxin system prevent-host-death family antitoxin [Methylococcaceae bacterium]|nr:type II toxin-antitoxin system prevent-host-death family antitoxin [Methylococcaceae bacterium]
MQSLFFKDAQQNLDQLCLKACQDHEPYIINREDNNHVVILSLADFNAWQETHYLLSNPVNAKRLLHSLEQARNGQLLQNDLLEE